MVTNWSGTTFCCSLPSSPTIPRFLLLLTNKHGTMHCVIVCRTCFAFAQWNSWGPFLFFRMWAWRLSCRRFYKQTAVLLHAEMRSLVQNHEVRGCVLWIQSPRRCVTKALCCSFLCFNDSQFPMCLRFCIVRVWSVLRWSRARTRRGSRRRPGRLLSKALLLNDDMMCWQAKQRPTDIPMV